ncbi:T9SS type A sorting domain-containing protein [bacterium]|nr:T9SS type A sorting domain-containing protein [bacterium]
MQRRDVLISWFTSFEYLHDGFNLYRSRLLSSDYAKLNDGLIRGRSPYSYLDRSVQPSTTYYYKVGAVDWRGHEVIHATTSVTTAAWGDPTALSRARPSPFGHQTLIEFTLSAPAHAKLTVYDVAGRLVRVLVEEDLPDGKHEVTWNGRDDDGLRVSGGTYFVKLTASDVTQTRKVVFLGAQ